MKSWRKGVAVSAAVLIGAAAYAGEHTWDVWEVFSNFDGTVQFIELRETNGGAAENGVNGNVMLASPSGHTFTIPAPVVGSTSFHSYLMATTGFAALPGAPTPDAIIPNGFLSLSDTSVAYQPWDTATWAADSLPTDGIHSLSRTATNGPLSVQNATPTNFAGGTTQPTLPGEPSLTASRLTTDGTSLSVSWDTAACGGEVDHQILFGNKSNFPALVGGNYTLQGGTCDIGTAAPYTWTAPSATDGSGLIWFLVVAENNAGREGSWGKYDATNERNGSGTGGSSGVCSITNRDLSNTCGH
jgi:hypothetical protein